MAPDNTAPHPDNSPPREEPLPRRVFPSPRRRADPLPAPPGWQQWTMRGLLAVAILMATVAAWIYFHPDNTVAPAPIGSAQPETQPPGPPDAARDIYLSSVLLVPGPTPTPTPTPTQLSASLRTLTDLETRYLGALTAAMRHVPENGRAQFAAEIERLNTDAPLPPPHDGIHPELARLQSIYRLELAKQR